jgi:hypothetical protein
MYVSMVFYFAFPFPAEALTVANACVASLEAERNASRKAWDTATAAKVAAEKSAKSAAAKAKKAEKSAKSAATKPNAMPLERLGTLLLLPRLMLIRGMFREDKP